MPPPASPPPSPDCGDGSFHSSLLSDKDVTFISAGTTYYENLPGTGGQIEFLHVYWLTYCEVKYEVQVYARHNTAQKTWKTVRTCTATGAVAPSNLATKCVQLPYGDNPMITWYPDDAKWRLKVSNPEALSLIHI